MSENTPSSDNGGLNDPLKLRNTDTGTLKRVPAATPSIASSAARKTIKLKPLTATPDAEGTVSTATIPMGQAPQSRTVSTATIPLSPSPKPVSMPPPKPSAVPTTTQGIARPTETFEPDCTAGSTEAGPDDDAGHCQAEACCRSPETGGRCCSDNDTGHCQAEAFEPDCTAGSTETGSDNDTGHRQAFFSFNFIGSSSVRSPDCQTGDQIASFCGSG